MVLTIYNKMFTFSFSTSSTVKYVIHILISGIPKINRKNAKDTSNLELYFFIRIMTHVFIGKYCNLKIAVEVNWSFFSIVDIEAYF